MDPIAVFLISSPGESARYDYGPIIDTKETRPGHPRSETIITVRGQLSVWHMFAQSAYVLVEGM